MSVNRVAGNALWSLAGQIVPILVAILTVPLLIRYMGLDRFGFLSLAWALVGYAGLFDFGISRAMTRTVAARLGAGDESGALHVARVGTALMSLFGLTVCVVLWLCAESLVHGWLNVPEDLQEEAVGGLRVLAASIPLVMLTAAYRGTLEAWQAFRRLNLIRIVMGLLTYMGPLVAALIVPRLEWIIGSVTIMRILTTYLHAKVCASECGRIKPWHPLDGGTIRELVRLGGWMSVSNLVSPLMNYLDRFVLAGLVAVEMVAYYSTPYDMITRTLVFPYSVMAVIFPVLSAQSGSAKSSQTTYSTTIRMLMVLMFPICFSAVVLARPLLNLWLGAEFAEQATVVLQVLAVGVLANTLAQAPANLIQSTGNPKWMAILHLLELPIFIGALWFATRQFGIVGTAACWAARMVIDAAILFVLAGRHLHRPQMGSLWYIAAAGAIAALLVGASWPRSLIECGVTWFVGALLFAPLAWLCLLQASDRVVIRSLLAKRQGVAS